MRFFFMLLMLLSLLLMCKSQQFKDGDASMLLRHYPVMLSEKTTLGQGDSQWRDIEKVWIGRRKETNADRSGSVSRIGDEDVQVVHGHHEMFLGKDAKLIRIVGGCTRWYLMMLYDTTDVFRCDGTLAGE